MAKMIVEKTLLEPNCSILCLKLKRPLHQRHLLLKVWTNANFFNFQFQIRQIIGKQGRLTVKNVAESQRQNQNLPLDSSTASSDPDSEKNPFLGRSLPR